MRIRTQLVPRKHAKKVTSAGVNACEYITVHETANRSRGANAAAHANLQAKGNSRAASWHWQVDDVEAVRSFPDTTRCWHAGDGGGLGLRASIAVEICVNADGDLAKARANAAALIRDLRAEHGIPADRVVQHHHWSGKNCPTLLRAEPGAWDAFVQATNPQEDDMPPLTDKDLDRIALAVWSYRNKTMSSRDAWGNLVRGQQAIERIVRAIATKLGVRL